MAPEVTAAPRGDPFALVTAPPRHGCKSHPLFLFHTSQEGEQAALSQLESQACLARGQTPNNPTSPPPGEGKLRHAAGPRLSEQQGEDAGADPKPTQTNRRANPRCAASRKGSFSSAALPCPAPELRPSGKPSRSPGAAPAQDAGMPKSPLCQQLVRGPQPSGAPGGLPDRQRSTKRGEVAAKGRY